MNLFASASALGSVFQGAAGLVQALKQPKLSSTQFATLLNQKLEQQQGSAGVQQAKAADALTQKFIALRDANGDAKLAKAESGLDLEKFELLDTDKDGYLSVTEVRAYAAARYQEAAQVLR